MAAVRLRAAAAVELTEFLQSCQCLIEAEQGKVCRRCGCHGEVGLHNNMCEVDDCNGVGDLLPCCACNCAFHVECMGDVHYGLDSARNPAPWCEECFEEWVKSGVALQNSAARRSVTIGYDPANRASGPSVGTEPTARLSPGRRRIQHTRVGPRASRNVALMPCGARPFCHNDCRRLTGLQRQVHRDEYDRLRRDVKTGAHRRSVVFAMQFVQREIEYAGRSAIHADAQGRQQRCKRCKYEPRALWDPVESHTLPNCNQREQPRSGGRYITVFRLHDGEGQFYY